MSNEQGRRVKIGSMAELQTAGRVSAEIDGRELVVFLSGGELRAYENSCPHLGGPVCSGSVMPRVEQIVEEDGSVQRQRFDHEDSRVVCPWHGYEFHLSTGVCVTDKRFRLKSHDVVQDGDEIYAVIA